MQLHREGPGAKHGPGLPSAPWWQELGDSEVGSCGPGRDRAVLLPHVRQTEKQRQGLDSRGRKKLFFASLVLGSMSPSVKLRRARRN